MGKKLLAKKSGRDFPQTAEATVTTRARRWVFLAAISLGLLMIGLDNSILYTALPQLREQLSTSETESLWIMNAYPLMMAGLLLGTGTLGDKIGHRRMFLVGLWIFGAASLAAGFAPNALFLIAARGLLGVGAAVMMPSTLALIRVTFTDTKERNKAIGIWGSVAVVGAAAEPVLGGLLLEFFWWGSVFLINVPVVVMALIVTVLIAPANQPNPTKRWDAISSLYALLALAGLVLTIKELANPNRNLGLLLAAIAIGAIGAIAFAHRQRNLEEPLLTFDIFRSRIFTGGVIAAAGAMVVMLGVELMTTQRFQLVADFTPLHAGLVVTAITLASVPASIMSGILLHRLGYAWLISGGFFSMAIGTGTAFLAGTQEVFPVFITGLVFIGIGAGTVIAASTTAIINSAPAHRAGMAAGVEEVSFEFGALLSVTITGSLISALYVLNAPDELPNDPLLGLAHPSLGQAAGTAYDQAYLAILLGIAVLAAILSAFSAWCFRGNRKGASHASQ